MKSFPNKIGRLFLHCKRSECAPFQNTIAGICKRKINTDGKKRFKASDLICKNAASNFF